MLSEKEKKAIIQKIFEGSITISSLPKNLYKATVKKLLEALDEGFDNYKNDALYEELSTNIHIFSGAKTYTQVKDISSLILDGNKLRPFSEFKKMASEMYDLYNVTYLQTEYNTAIGQSQTAVKWQQIVEDQELFPYLQRSAVMDGVTSPDCAILNNLIAPVNSPLWITRSPLTHFNCRCILMQIDKYDSVKLSTSSQIKAAIEATKNINPLFKGNPGIDKVIFNKSHPYFDIAKKDKKAALENFNLPL